MTDKVKEESQETSEDTLGEEEKTSEKKSEEDVSEESEDKESEESKDEDKEEEKGDTKEKIDRTPRSIPYGKFKAERDKVKKLKGEVSTLETAAEELSQKQISQKDISKDLESLASEFGVEEKFLSQLVNLISSQNKIPQDVLNKVAKIDGLTDGRFQDEMFEKEFNKLVKDNPTVGGFKSKLKELAFSEEFAKAPLKRIFLAHPEEFKTKKTAETSKRGTGEGGGVTFQDINDMPDEEKAKAIKGMDDKTYDKFSKWLSDKQGGPRIVRG